MTNNPTTPKEQVLAWVRSKNPQTMELKFGCKLRVKEDDKHYGGKLFYFVEYHFNLCPTVKLCEGEVPPSEGDYTAEDEAMSMGHISEDPNDPHNSYEILGSDMGLQELIISLQGCRKEEFIGFDRFGYLMLWDNENETDVVTDIQFDLTKNLHSQSEEFYESFLPLIT